jgi:hypothetical protein
MSRQKKPHKLLTESRSEIEERITETEKKIKVLEKQTPYPYEKIAPLNITLAGLKHKLSEREYL